MFIAAVFRSWEWLMDSWNKPSPKHQLFIRKKEIYLISRSIYISLYIQTPFQRIYTDHCHVRLAFHSSVLAMLWASVSSFALQAAVPWATRRLVLPSSSLCASSSSVSVATPSVLPDQLPSALLLRMDCVHLGLHSSRLKKAAASRKLWADTCKPGQRASCTTSRFCPTWYALWVAQGKASPTKSGCTLWETE